jgi:ribosome-binding factor A
MMRRHRKIEHLIQQELSELIKRQTKDPRLKGLITVTDVSTSADLRHATVFVSIMGSEEEGEETLQGLGSACGFLRRELGKRVSLRYTPQLSFEKDRSIEQGTHLLSLIEQVCTEDGDKS